ncbi:MAG: RcnB family protein, partial [Caulobacter sp.]|nr:RcnB family protein [Caulobacter sp.]
PGFRPVPGPRWRYPPGYRYRRWNIGVVLPSLFLTPTYYYDDYWRMGLEGPPWGYQWVRYGPDLLLVNTRTGRIDDVIYGAFY